MYTDTNFRTKKALKEAVADGRQERIHQPGGMFNPPEADLNYSGKATIEGPHYPAPHTWYASVVLSNGIIIAVK